MPVIGNSPWIDAARAGEGIGQGIGQMAIQIPRARAEAALMRQSLLEQQQRMSLEAQAAPLHRSVLAAQAGMMGAHGDLYKARAVDQQTQNQAHVELGAAGGRFVQEAMSSDGQVTPETASALAQAMARAQKVDPKIMQNFNQIVALGSSHLKGNPSLGAAVMTGAKVPVNEVIPKGGTLANAMTGQPTAVGTQTVGAGQFVTQPRQITYDATTGQPNVAGGLAIAAQSPYPPNQRGYNVDPLVQSVIHGAGPGSINLKDVPGTLAKIQAIKQGLNQGQATSGFRPAQVVGSEQSTQAQPVQTNENGHVIDNKGNKWIYKGTMQDPKQDKDQSNWQMVQ